MEQTTSIKLILDKILRHPLMKELNFETAIDYTVDFMRIVGVPSMYEEKVATLKVSNYRALLPCDFQEVIYIRDSDNKKAYKYSTDNFHMGETKAFDNEYTYKIQGGIIYTSQKDCNIDLSYRAISVDDEGYPLLPDNSSFTRALELYIKKQWFTILFDMGKIHGNILQNVQQEYAWAVGDCESEFKRMSIDKMQAFTNSWNTLIQRAY